VRTWAGFVYVAFVVDVFAQRIVSWHAMTTKPAELVLIPLRMAAWSRGQQGHPITRGDLIAHSDAGSIHTALRYTEHLALEGIAASTGTVGDAYDNSLMETIIGLFKTEAIRPAPSTPARSSTSATSSSRPWPGSTGSTTGACTPASACSPPSKPRPLTTLQPLPSTRSRNQYENSTEPVTVHPLRNPVRFIRRLAPAWGLYRTHPTDARKEPLESGGSTPEVRSYSVTSPYREPLAVRAVLGWWCPQVEGHRSRP
jgi:transposase InsO family protein